MGTVSALTHEGEGIMRGGKTAFVAGALPGERISFRRVRQHRQHDDAQLIEVLEPSSERVAPRCSHFGICGGCALQHLEPAAQLAAKQRELQEALQRIGHVEPRTWLEPLAGPVWNYRRKARLGARYVARKGRVVVGFRERLSPYVAALERCEVLGGRVGELIAPLSALLTSLSLRARIPQIEVAVADSATALVIRVLDAPTGEDLQRLREFERLYSVQLYLQPQGLESVQPLDGRPPVPLVYRLEQFDLTLEFGPADFIQVNGPVNESLVARAVQLLDAPRDARVLDLFCGIGNFTLALARSVAQVRGVEAEAGLIARARANAARNGIDNAEFMVANLMEAGEAGWARDPVSHVLLDPPRSGAREVLPTLARLAPRRILYISCHPGSLARDVGILVNEHGFALQAAGVVDMFPHTTHVESIALLSAV